MASGQPTPATGVPTCYRHPGRETHIKCQRCERPICPDCMVDAAVGFQCPTCVAEGRKQTRSGMAAYGGRRSANPALTSIALIATNVAVWLGILATGWQQSDLIQRLALSPLGTCWLADGTGYYPNATEAVCAGSDTEWLSGVADGAYWQLVTSMFTHVEIWHIAFNMLALFVLGPQLELMLGRVRFLALYLLSGLSGSAFVYWLSDEHSATLGASGAIFGLMGALVVVAFKVRANVQQLLVLVGINVFITVVGSAYISWQGHLGGLVGGILLGAALVYAPRQRRTAYQAAAFGLVTAALAVAVLARTAVLG